MKKNILIVGLLLLSTLNLQALAASPLVGAWKTNCTSMAYGNPFNVISFELNADGSGTMSQVEYGKSDCGVDSIWSTTIYQIDYVATADHINIKGDANRHTWVINSPAEAQFANSSQMYFNDCNTHHFEAYHAYQCDMHGSGNVPFGNMRYSLNEKGQFDLHFCLFSDENGSVDQCWNLELDRQ